MVKHSVTACLLGTAIALLLQGGTIQDTIHIGNNVRTIYKTELNLNKVRMRISLANEDKPRKHLLDSAETYDSIIQRNKDAFLITNAATQDANAVRLWGTTISYGDLLFAQCLTRIGTAFNLYADSGTVRVEFVRLWDRVPNYYSTLTSFVAGPQLMKDGEPYCDPDKEQTYHSQELRTRNIFGYTDNTVLYIITLPYKSSLDEAIVIARSYNLYNAMCVDDDTLLITEDFKVMPEKNETTHVLSIMTGTEQKWETIRQRGISNRGNLLDCY